MKHYTWLLLMATLGWSSCGTNAKKDKADLKDSLVNKSAEEWNASIPGNFSEQQALLLDSTSIDSFVNAFPQLKSVQPELDQFYRQRQYRYAWFDAQGLIEQAGNLADRVSNLSAEGLQDSLYYLAELDSLQHNYAQRMNTRPSPTLELLLSAQYFVFAKMAWEGQDESVSKKTDWFVPRKKVSYVDYLDSLLARPADADLSAIEPVYRQYEQLRTYLKDYQELEKKMSWGRLEPEKRSYRPDDSSSLILAVRKRLYHLKDFTGDTITNVYTRDLEEGVKAFQVRHGLSADGVMGPSFFEALNVPVRKRIEQMAVNMERSRWLPVKQDGDYLAVNIPEFKLHVYHDDSLLWDCNVVVGKSAHKTVIFHGDIKYVVFSPYWNVPPSIVRNEVMPGMKHDRNYIAKHRMEITGYSGSVPNVRQKPGPSNSLGLIKFLFPNSYNIYLHDTPSKSLFKEDQRAFSHGCIRVSEPEKLADFLLQQDPDWTPERIHEAMNTGKEKYVTLKNTVPVFIVYFTAFIDRNGKINFRKDVYNRDERLKEMLFKKG